MILEHDTRLLLETDETYDNRVTNPPGPFNFWPPFAQRHHRRYHRKRPSLATFEDHNHSLSFK